MNKRPVCFVQFANDKLQEPEIIEENLGKDFIRVILSQSINKKWYYSWQLHVAPFIKAHYPDPEICYTNRAEALAAARQEIRQLLESSRETKKLINDFPVLFHGQLEFEFE